MGAVSSIDMVLPSRVHLCISEEDTTEYKIIKLLEEKLMENQLIITKTQSTHSVTEMQDILNKSSMMIIFITNQTPRSYFQAREIDYAKQGYRKIFYILLDVKYSQNKDDWVRNFIGQDEWIQYDKTIDIDTVTYGCMNAFTKCRIGNAI
jgi:hypothetical protein